MRIVGIGMALSLISNTLVTIAPARALPESQIVEKLRETLVFTITNQAGEPLTASDDKKNNYAGGYMSQKEAQAFLQEIQKKDPNLAKQLQIRPTVLSALYNAQYNKPADRKLDIVYVPSQQQAKAALAIQQKTNRNIKNFSGVPLFVITGGKPPAYIKFNVNGKKVIPLFFDQEQVTPFVNVFKKDRPELAATAEIQVITLEGLITTLRNKNKDDLTSQIMLYPSREAIDYTRNNNKPTTSRPVTTKKTK
jgi:Tic22-like family